MKKKEKKKSPGPLIRLALVRSAGFTALLTQLPWVGMNRGQTYRGQGLPCALTQKRGFAYIQMLVLAQKRPWKDAT